MLYTEIFSDIQNIFCTHHVLPMFCKKKSFWQRFTCTKYLFTYDYLKFQNYKICWVLMTLYYQLITDLCSQSWSFSWSWWKRHHPWQGYGQSTLCERPNYWNVRQIPIHKFTIFLLNYLINNFILWFRTSAALKGYTNTTRKCNDGENERQLKYYAKYSRSNCQNEVRVDTYGSECGCKPYYYPGK